uniref:Uncharacterized protein n=1 Tax=Lotharella globosa TaxID=91324 RepID=A0A7S3ZDB5_9EUKA|mmetsp:Transcript_17114/g.32555  ORF Transcript_17114/g.32555 Transcript_17114/m.32555 type:complete len:264 (+) Transcript_17114:152-943(+)
MDIFNPSKPCDGAREPHAVSDRKKGLRGGHPFQRRSEGLRLSQSKNPLENHFSSTRTIFSASMPVRAKTDIFGSSSKPVYRSISRCASARLYTSEDDEYRSSGIQESIVVPRPLPFAYEKNTSFECHRSAVDIFRALQAALRSNTSCQLIDPKPHKGKIKCRGTIMGQDIRFQVHIFAKNKGQDGHVVEFQRRSGDSCCFWHMFADTMITLSMDLADAATFVERANLKKNKDLMKLWSPLSLKPSFSPLDELAESLCAIGRQP